MSHRIWIPTLVAIAVAAIALERSLDTDTGEVEVEPGPRANRLAAEASPYLDLRTWFRGRDGRWRPTRRGVVGAVEQLEMLEVAVRSLREAAGVPGTP